VDGEILTTASGSWSSPTQVSYSYQWVRCAADGAGCQDIAGATSTTRTLAPADIGSRLKARVTATNAAGSSTADSPLSGVVAGVPPSNSSAPTISGTPVNGQSLTASDGTWSGSPTITLARQWRRCDSAGDNCQDVAGATAATYALSGADVGKTIRVRVTGTSAYGATAASSAPTGVVGSSPPTNVAAPTISGPAVDGQWLTPDDGSWTGDGNMSYRHQWVRCDSAGSNCQDIAGGTDYAYRLTAADIGRRVKMRVIVTSEYGTGTANSNLTGVVAAAPPTNSAPPSIGGTATDGQQLAMTDGGNWNGTGPFSWSYRWVRCDSAGNNCQDITGATASRYTLTPSDVGKRVRMRLTATSQHGSDSGLSAPTAVVSGVAPTNTTAPTVSGTTTDGQSLTASDGSWSGTPTIGYTRQWARCDSAGSNCQDIAGATAATYRLTSTDIGRRIRVRVTGTSPYGSSSALSSLTQAVTGAAPSNTTPPKISGTASVPQTLTMSDGGAWSGTQPFSWTYRWFRCNAAGTSCQSTSTTASSYKLTGSDKGSTLRLRLTATNAYGSAFADSAPSAVVQ
jgi:hypothetical protein